jgi:hypothetical protein
MTIYPAEFHRRLEQKWARRAQLSKASETMSRPRTFVRPYRITTLAAPRRSNEIDSICIRAQQQTRKNKYPKNRVS